MKKIYLLLVILFSLNVGAVDYEQCDCRNEDITARVTNPILDRVAQLASSSNLDCHHCTPQSEMLNVTEYILEATPENLDVLGNQKKRVEAEALDLTPHGKVNPKCILASGLNNSKAEAGKGQYRVCNEDRNSIFINYGYPTPKCGKGSTAYVRRYCLNEDYVKVTTDALNLVANCFDIPPKSLFALFNHESRFILNNVSPSKALCYGQLTTGTVETLNNANNTRYEYYSHLNPESISREEHDSIKLNHELGKDNPSCNVVKGLFDPVDVVSKETSRGVAYTAYKNTSQICSIVSNPYTCMVYSAMNYKRNNVYAKRFLDDAFVFLSDTPRKETGAYVIHKDKHTLVDFMERKGSDPTWNYLSYKDHPIFTNKGQVAEILAFYAHNGGWHGIKSLYYQYLTELKIRLDLSSNVELREDFIDGGISTERFIKEFKEHIASHYRWGSSAKNIENRKIEVSTFVDKIIKDAEDIKDQGVPLSSCIPYASSVYEIISAEGEGE